MTSDADRLDALEDPLGTQFLFSAPKAKLPTGGLRNGAHAFAEDGRKDSEGAGTGTGVPVWWDATSDTWRTYTTGAEVTT